jgi:hypothetical protein
VSDHFPGEIRIGGPIPRAALKALVRAAAQEGASLEGYGGPAADRDALRQAFREGAIVTLYDDQARYGEFDGLEAFLVRHRIHFDRHSEAFCEYNAEIVSYRGGQEAVALPADQSGHIMLCWEEVVGILDDSALDDGGKVGAIRRLVARPETEPLAPIRLV